MKIKTSVFNIANKVISYCVNETLTCKPALVFVIGKALLILGIFLFCSKNSFMLTLLLTT